MRLLHKIKNKLLGKANQRIGEFLRSHYASFHVTRPYVINLDSRKSLKGRIAIVTGGSGAIGRACSCQLAANGAKVYVCGSSINSAEKVSNEIRKMGFQAEPIALDIRNYESIKETFSNIYNKEGHIDILINSAGGSARDNANQLVYQDFSIINNLLEINLRGTILCCKEAAFYMLKHHYGRIVNITSVIGLQGKSGFSEYAASKGGIIALTKSLAQELGKSGITVNGVAPGIVQRGEITPETIKHLEQTNFMGTYGKPEDISAAVCFFCSEEASFITGQNLAVDGGRSLGLKEA